MRQHRPAEVCAVVGGGRRTLVEVGGHDSRPPAAVRRMLGLFRVGEEVLCCPGPSPPVYGTCAAGRNACAGRRCRAGRGARAPLTKCS